MPTTLANDPGEIRSLTGLRLFAAAWVVLFHFQFTHGQLLERVLAPGFAFVTTGAMGVDLFYVLSGFVIAFTYLPRIGVRFSWTASRKFIWARVCRIWPVYAVVTMAFGGWLLFKASYWDLAEPAYQNVQPTVSVGAWLQQMFMVQIWWRPWHDGASWVGPAWSISAEWLAYVLFPVTALLFWRLRHLPRWLLGAVAVLVMAPEAYLCFTTGSPYFPFSWMSRILTGFTAGVLVYLVVRDIPRTDRVRRVATWLSWVVVALILGGLVFGNWLGAAPEGTERGGLVLVLFPPLVGVLALAGSRGIGRLFATRLAVHGGRISYSLYLIHVPVFEVLWTAMERIGVMHDDGTLATALTPLAFAFVFVLADLLYRLIEEPARRALRRR
ncbi:acyltransferase family protein, partial [Pseudonocardia spinosispora]|uniref:acyltransferase family protein n=1 Tax=Pseudonocardia spinosispora TaxID=103441 RepID=UPI0003FE0A07